MQNSEWLIELFNRRDVTDTLKVMAVLLIPGSEVQTVSKIKEVCISHGFTPSNVAQFLTHAQSQRLVTKLPDGWRLTSNGRAQLKDKGVIFPENSVIFSARNDLRIQLEKVKTATTHRFMDECIKCLEGNLLRSSVVMSWIGAMAILYEHIFMNYLTEFNSEASRRNTKWKNATTVDDFSSMKENDFLDVIESIKIIDKNVKKQLKTCLDLRNTCSHPNSAPIGVQAVAHHIEVLILNVYSKYLI